MKLNLGCGTDYIEDWVNVDSGNTKCDVKHDIQEFPWPFDNSSVTEIKMHHILEHIQRDKFIPFMRELYRVCVNDAIVKIESPYAGSDNYFTDPTHSFPVTVRTFDFFDETKALFVNGTIYGWSDIKLRVIEAAKLSNEPNGPDVKHILKIIK